ncbi:MAG: LPXTG cell wall anchor domain-containing protein, partial [Aeriscardovia sp.]|nr:LPXTG cell wall anchor domain-containing protein [Aeriscardovia sp.]
NPSDIDGAGIPRSTLKAKGASVSFDEANETCPDDAEGSCTAAILISLPSSLISYIASHSFKPATVSEAAGAVPFAASFGQLSVTFRAYLNASKGIAKSPSIWEGYEYQLDGSNFFYFGSFSSPQVYTNGPADDCAPSSLTVPSSPSSSTGLQFQSLWWGSGAPAKGAKFTVQNENEGSPYYGEYLNGDPSDFTGWSWSKSPQDFSQSTPQAIFSFGGLADGTYTVTEVDPATGATPPSSLSFTGNLSYSSPESLKAVSDPMNLLSPAQRAVYFVVVPSRLPLTGGKGISALALAAVFLAALGAGAWVGLRRRGRSPSSKRRRF